jgi:hypothetical protein
MGYVNSNDKLRRLSRKNGVKVTSDPAGVVATLQIAKRLVGERKDKALYLALDEALEMAAPKDRAQTWWASHRAVVGQLPSGFTSIDQFTKSGDTSVEDVLDLLSRAVKNQGEVNLVAAKGGAK